MNQGAQMLVVTNNLDEKSTANEQAASMRGLSVKKVDCG